MKSLFMFAMLATGLMAQVEKAKPGEVAQREGYAIFDIEQQMGCFVTSVNVRDKIMIVDCSRALPVSPKSKTIRDYCVVPFGEMLLAAWVEKTSRVLLRCETAKDKR